ncbi:hypothetical protein B0H14DRAFT_3750997 [Mycena olivaceomarginata]|nr:hypothetical protein B0H14DRAFT_3750997 [Mycena olivaceomarginata]
MPSSEEIVLVTGVTGFVASHVAKELLEDGFIVRGTAQGDKLAELKSQAAVAKNPRFQAIEVKDIATDDLTDTLKGRATPEEGLKAALQGTLNVLEQADKVGISKVVLTSSWATTMDPSLEKMFQGGVLTAKGGAFLSKGRRV